MNKIIIIGLCIVLLIASIQYGSTEEIEDKSNNDSPLDNTLARFDTHLAQFDTRLEQFDKHLDNLEQAVSQLLSSYNDKK